MDNLFYKVLFYCLFLSTFTQAQKFTYKEIPQWVVQVDTIVDTKVSKYDVTSGFYVSLADYQINLAEDSYFNHTITNVISFSGITNASQLAITYDTSYQDLEIHHLYILRNGKKVDRTKELSLEILNNEQALHMGIYTGQITAYDILEDIRKDDYIDFAYSLIGSNPIFEGEKYFLSALESINPIDYFSLRIIYPEDKNYLYECVGCDSSNISEIIVDGFHKITIEYNNIPPVELEDMMTSWTIPYKYFILSSIHSWNEVYEWAEHVFDLETEQNLEEVFEEVFTGDENIDDKINKLINFVQDDIRYMGIESGIGSIKPFPPEQVVKQRFGDCKDKSLLLVSLLNKIGVKRAYPALVNTNMQKNITTLLPGVKIFDHCIVYFEHNDTSYWVDPSIVQQGGSYKNIFTYNYGKALIIGMNADSLYNIDVDYPNSHYTITEEYTVNSFDEPTSLKIESVRFGMEADQGRALLEYYSLKDISDLVTSDLA